MIRFIDIVHYAGDRELYSGLTWHIRPGERIGLIGDNGTGKTTLLRMAVGEQEPVSGAVNVRKNARIGYLRQEIHAFEGSESVAQETMKAFEIEQKAAAEIEQLYEKVSQTDAEEHDELLARIHDLQKVVYHHDAAAAEADARKILSGLGFSNDDCDRPLAEFSGGWQMRAQIARLLLERPDLLLLDEPTNHLDLESINWLEQFLQSFAGALVVVSHDRWFLDRMTTRTAWIYQRKIRTFACNYSGFVIEREVEEEQLTRRWKNQQEEIERIQQFIDRFRYKATKAAAVQSRVKMLEKIERIELPAGMKRVRLRIPEPYPCGRNILELRDVGKAYGDNRVFKFVNLKVDLGEKIALVGRNGAGKSTLLKICAGVLDYEGVRELHPKARSEYFSQHRIDTLNPDNSALEEARPAGAAQSDEQLRSLLGCFLFTGDDVFKPVRVLSGGEKSRLALARMMLRQGNLLLLDEPTNHLDISTREVLQEALREFPGTIIMISHDRHFIDSLATKIVEVADGNVMVHYGNYSDYMAKKGGEAEADLRGRNLATAKTKAIAGGTSISGALAAIELAKTDRQEQRRNSADQRRDKAEKRNNLSRRIKRLQDEIEVKETRLAEIHGLQADPQAYASGSVTPEIASEGKSLETEIPGLLTEWEALVEEYEELKA